jgi:alkylation response protein AidB-like acyl-CoA dehydrogenase
VDFNWTESEDLFRAELRSYIDEHINPSWSQLGRDAPTIESIKEVIEFCKGLAERGLLTPAWPAEFGGRDASLWEQTVLSEELWGMGEPRGPQYMNVNWIGPAIMKLGTPEQQELHLSAISKGEAMWCQGFSEPEAGSDLSALRTFAAIDGDEYVVNGQKIWTSYAHAADYCFLLVRTKNTENPRKGISILLMPMDLPGIEVREIESLGYPHLVHEVFFSDVRVPVSCRLGPENQGWSIIRELLANERVGNARHEWIHRSLDRLITEAFDADVDTTDERFWETLGRVAAWTEASRVLNYVCVQAACDESNEYSNLAAVYRVALAQMEIGATHAYLDVLGPDSLTETSRGDYQLISGILASIGGGSLEMALNSIAWHTLGLPKG